MLRWLHALISDQFGKYRGKEPIENGNEDKTQEDLWDVVKKTQGDHDKKQPVKMYKPECSQSGRGHCVSG